MIQEVADLKRYRYETEQTLSKLAVDIFKLQDITLTHDKKLNATIIANNDGQSDPEAAIVDGASNDAPILQDAGESPQQQQAPTSDTSTAQSYSEAAQQPPQQTPPTQLRTSPDHVEGYISLRPQGGWPPHPSIPPRPKAGKQTSPAGRTQQQRNKRQQASLQNSSPADAQR